MQAIICTYILVSISRNIRNGKKYLNLYSIVGTLHLQNVTCLNFKISITTNTFLTIEVASGVY